MKQWRAAAVAAATILVVAGGRPVAAQQPAVKVGVVSMEDVFNRCDARKAGEDQVQALANKLRERLSALRDSSLLPANSWQQYRGLLEKDKPTDAEAAQLTAFKTQVTQLDDELKKLQQTPSPNDAQKARLNDLNGNITANTGNLQVAAQDYDKQIIKLQMDLRNQIVIQIQAAADLVCKQQGCLVVLNKTLTIGDEVAQLLVIAGGLDVTDAVVKQVNSAKK
jgi:Skp family chaperone for outer membrane proteins